MRSINKYLLVVIGVFYLTAFFEVEIGETHQDYRDVYDYYLFQKGPVSQKPACIDLPSLVTPSFTDTYPTMDRCAYNSDLFVYHSPPPKKKHSLFIRNRLLLI
jgi:hypothetical protein